MLRPYMPQDSAACFALLAAEGLREQDMRFREGITGVLDDHGIRGFFTLELSGGVPSLRHFYARPGAAWVLMRAVRKTVLLAGFSVMLVHAKHERVAKALRWYFRPQYSWRMSDGVWASQVRV